MPVVDEDGNIGYYEWEAVDDIEWLGISRDSMSPKTIVQDLNEIDAILKKEEDDAIR